MPPDYHDPHFSRARDEIGEIARQYMLEPECTGLGRIDCLISRALIDGDWDALHKWHRVKLRLQRMHQEQAMARRLGCG